VLGDELCHGTESASAVSLVAASIMHLSAKDTSFIFATHLHELATMDEITGLHNVEQYHLTISFDSDDSIVYDRLMKKGSGNVFYGVEVAKHLKIPQGVIEKAYSIRNKYYSKDTESVVSTYNSKVVVSTCKIPDCTNDATETHHIMFQSESDSNGLIGAVHKNTAKNLVPLCEMHHNMVHHGTVHQGTDEELIILGYGLDSRIKCEIRPILRTLNCTKIVFPRTLWV
jgi:DNA mismatch repair protein MutS